MTLHVDSEVGTLRQAILHRPDLELKRLTPTNKDSYLFDDVLWVTRAKQEHDAFAEALRDLDVRVHLFDALLRETVAIPEARRHILDASSTSGSTARWPPTRSTTPSRRWTTRRW